MIQAVNGTLADAMEEDKRVMVLGQDIGKNGGVFRATDELQERFGEDRVVDTPLAEGELGVDLELVEGSGSGGRVMEGDVRAFVEADGEAASADRGADGEAEGAAAAPADGTRKASERVPLRGIQRSMFTNMARSASTVAHSFGLEEADVTELVTLRRQMKGAAEEKGARLTYLPFVVKAAVTAPKEFPYLNASVDDEEQQVLLHNRYDIGIAVDTPQGLLAPVVRDADEKSIFGLAREIVDLAERARDGKLGMEDFEGGTFTVTNVGSIGGVAAMPVVDHPQVAILGLHRIQRKPAVRGKEEEIVVRDMMNMSLSFDHRVIDGAACFNFLARVTNLLFMEMA